MFLLIIGLLFYILESYAIFCNDDYFYTYICEDATFLDAISGKKKVENIRDIFVSQYNHWQLINGRYIAHTIVQLFCGILGFEMFKICNTIVFVLFINYYIKLCRLFVKQINAIICFIVLWISLGFVDVGFGMMTSVAHSVNYLWSSLGYTWLLYKIFEYNLDNANRTSTILYKILLFILAFIAGGMNESFSVGLSMALFLYMLINREKYKSPNEILFLAFGLWLGTIVLCVNPANILRFSSENNSSFTREFMLRFFWLGSNWRLLVPVIFTAIIAAIKYVKNGYKYYNNYSLMIITIICTLFFLFVVGLKGSYQMFTSITILSSAIISTIAFEKVAAYKNLYIVLVSVIMLIHFAFVVNLRLKQYNYWDYVVSSYVTSTNGYVYIDDMDILYNGDVCDDIIKAYGATIDYNMSDFNYSGIEVYYSDATKPLRLVPTNMNLVGENNIYDADWCYVIRTPEDVEYEVKVTDFTHKNWMLKLWSKYSNSATSHFYLDSYEVMIDDQKYTIALKKNDDFIINKIELTQKVID
ncbi:MAG: hypothetical protein IJN01_02375 [Rikenellaceae bacterium]|nr:hypothetical protein [Rikenellaceae bacterium]